jgi:hypothetical protein
MRIVNAPECSFMTSSRGSWTWVVIGFAVAFAAQYWVLTEVLWLDLNRQRRIALLFALAALTGGAAWIGALTLNKTAPPAAKWPALIGPFGLTQVLGGVTLLFWVGGFEVLTIVAGATLLLCVTVFMFWPHRQ